MVPSNVHVPLIALISIFHHLWFEYTVQIVYKDTSYTLEQQGM